MTGRGIGEVGGIAGTAETVILNGPVAGRIIGGAGCLIGTGLTICNGGAFGNDGDTTVFTGTADGRTI